MRTGKRGKAGFYRALLFVLFPVFAASDTSIFAVGRFSMEAAGETLPAAWHPLRFEKIKTHTQYRLVKDGVVTVMQASSRASASGLIRKVHIDPEEYPLIQWDWKIRNVLAGGDIQQKKGDDYPARLYITFDYDKDRLGIYEKLKYETYSLIHGEPPPLAALSYVWGNKAPVETLAPNAYTERVMMIVTQSGPDRLDQWVRNQRNLYQDYIRAFGEPPPPISAVAIMTDTDNTGEQASAYYGDILFLKNPADAVIEDLRRR